MRSLKDLYNRLPKQVRAAIPGLVILAVMAAALSVNDQSPEAGPATTNSSADTNSNSSADTNSSATPSSSATTNSSANTAAGSARFSDLPVVARSALPPEAHDTLDDIASGGPYDFNKDDSVFQNREGILPDYPVGHYREYTVITPGSDDRGARRIVAGDGGGLYYTDDHYSSFSEISQ